ncbi:MAG TPA: hypothetical protein VFR15_01765 [Chloroflexia bacterium]|nr:hypothetical protein [Chloroflexia bacterium]
MRDSSRIGKVLTLTVVLVVMLVGASIVAYFGLVELPAYLQPPPNTIQAPLIYPNAQHVAVTPATLTQLGYQTVSFETSDSRAQVRKFYSDNLMAEGWWGESDTGGPDLLRLNWCDQPTCREMYGIDVHINNSSSIEGQPQVTQVIIYLSVRPYAR